MELKILIPPTPEKVKIKEPLRRLLFWVIMPFAAGAFIFLNLEKLDGGWTTWMPLIAFFLSTTSALVRLVFFVEVLTKWWDYEPRLNASNYTFKKDFQKNLLEKSAPTIAAMIRHANNSKYASIAELKEQREHIELEVVVVIEEVDKSGETPLLSGIFSLCVNGYTVITRRVTAATESEWENVFKNTEIVMASQGIAFDKLKVD